MFFLFQERLDIYTFISGVYIFIPVAERYTEVKADLNRFK